MPEFPDSLLLRVIVAILATWLFPAMFAEHIAGPFEIFERLRYMAGEGQLGNLLDCIWCMSFWMAWVVLGLVWLGAWWVLAGLALASASILIHLRSVRHD